MASDRMIRAELGHQELAHYSPPPVRRRRHSDVIRVYVQDTRAILQVLARCGGVRSGEPCGAWFALPPMSKEANATLNTSQSAT